MSEYCLRCGQKVTPKNFLHNFIPGGIANQAIELEEGMYCLKCAKIVVERRRFGKEKREIKEVDDGERSGA